MSMSAILKNHIKSPFPEMDFNLCDKPVAADTIYSYTPYNDDGSIRYRFF